MGLSFNPRPHISHMGCYGYCYKPDLKSFFIQFLLFFHSILVLGALHLLQALLATSCIFPNVSHKSFWNEYTSDSPTATLHGALDYWH